jgi:hypothetical protein
MEKMEFPANELEDFMVSSVKDYDRTSFNKMGYDA